MSHILNIERYYKASKERDKAERRYDKCNEEYHDSIKDYGIYCRILDRVWSHYIKLSACNYERMIHIKKYEVDDKNMIATITGDSIEINGNKVTFQDNITIKFQMTDDCELLYWTYEKSFMPYDISDWSSFTMKALKMLK